MPRAKVPTISSIRILLTMTIILSVVLGSQSLLSFYPSDILITPNTKFSTTFSNISANQITFSANQVQSISPGDALPLSTGGYLRFKASQTPNIGEALKYGRYQLNHILLLERSLSDWDITSRHTISTNSPTQKLTISYNQSLSSVEVKTLNTLYYVKLPKNSFALVSSEDNAMLYKLSRNSDTSVKVTLIGYYDNSIQVYQS